ncbi:MAG TPA: molybdopterin oxidoreductase family protein [Streptosporangiaceae bacterium]|nr:molybdopterin oxidoreductase family protein [Streptosporangiaceae bacterium]
MRPQVVGGGVPTHCPYCALQCAMTLRPRRDGGLDVEPRDFPVNGGGLCRKGWTAAELLSSPDRLTTPLMRASRTAPLEPVSWDAALDRVAAELRRIQDAHGPDAVAVFGGGGLTNEKAYQLGKFARVALRTANIDYNGRFCMSSAAAAVSGALGVDRGLPFPVTDIAQAGTVLLVGANVAETMPPFVRHLPRPGDDRELIVIDPRRSQTARDADLHLQVTPGTDLALANGLLHIAIAEGLIDSEYIAARTTGFAEVRRNVAAYWPERVERITGVPVSEQRAAVRRLAAGRARGGAMVLTARGAEQHSKGVDTVRAFVNLALALGLPGRPGSGFGSITGQGNGQGGREHGQKADQLPGYRRIDDPRARAHVAGVWGVDPADLPGPGRSAYELLESLGTPGGPKAMFVAGSNIAVSAPRAELAERRLAALDFLVVSDLVLSETAKLADVVLPAAQWAEEEGTMTNLEGRVLRRRRAVAPPPGVRTDLEILADLARRLGRPDGFDADPAAVFAELRRASAGGPADYSGITDEMLDSGAPVYWPNPRGRDDLRDDLRDELGDVLRDELREDEPAGGTPRLFADRFATSDGRARFAVVRHRPAAESVDEEFPLQLITGRVLAQYQSGSQTRRIRELREAEPGAFVELHPQLAERLGFAAGQRVRVVSRRGAAWAEVRLSEEIRLDTVFMPFHWPGAQRANLVTNPALDPVSRMPEFKICAVRLEPLLGTADELRPVAA